MKLNREVEYLTIFLIGLLCAVGLYYAIAQKLTHDEALKKANQIYNQEKRLEAQFEHAQMLNYMGRYVEAEREYTELLKANPHSVKIKVDLARVLYYQHRYEEALKLIEQIPSEQKNDQTTLLLADIALSFKKYSDAEVLYREYLQNFPEDRHVLLNYAKVLSWQKKFEPAVEIYENLLEKEPGNVQIRRQYSLVLIWMGKNAEGAEELEKTLDK